MSPWQSLIDLDNLWLPFLKDLDCKPFSACFWIKCLWAFSSSLSPFPSELIQHWYFDQIPSKYRVHWLFFKNNKINWLLFYLCNVIHNSYINNCITKGFLLLYFHLIVGCARLGYWDKLDNCGVGLSICSSQ